MELIYHKVPLEFLRTLPEGIKYINRHGKDFLVVEEVKCPKGHSLMVDTVRIHGEPTIRIDVLIGKEKGSFFIDSFWGSHDKLYTFIPSEKGEQTMVEAFCPVCGVSLMVQDTCSMPGCTSKKAILMTLPGGKNRIYECGRLGCPGHKIAITDIASEIAENVSNINYFGMQSEEIFKGI